MAVCGRPLEGVGIVFCTQCGAYASGVLRKLRLWCSGRPRTETATRALRRSLTGHHPNQHKYPQVLLGQSWPLHWAGGDEEPADAAAADGAEPDVALVVEAAPSNAGRGSSLPAVFRRPDRAEWDLAEEMDFFGL